MENYETIFFSVQDQEVVEATEIMEMEATGIMEMEATEIVEVNFKIVFTEIIFITNWDIKIIY